MYLLIFEQWSNIMFIKSILCCTQILSIHFTKCLIFLVYIKLNHCWGFRVDKFIIIVLWCSVLLLGVFSTVILSSALRPLIRIRRNFERNWESSHLTIFQTRDALEGRCFHIHAIWKNLWEVPKTKGSHVRLSYSSLNF